jgi:hypothetical protein
LFSHSAERFEVKRTVAREFFDELTSLADKELKRSGEFVLTGTVKLVVQALLLRRQLRESALDRRVSLSRRDSTRRERPRASQKIFAVAL